MNVRDLFAGLAMAGWMASCKGGVREHPALTNCEDEIAELSYEIADAMIRAGNRRRREEAEVFGARPMVVSKQEIEAARSERGGWTRKTLAGWGVPWPPPQGWKKKLINGEAFEDDEINRYLDMGRGAA